MPYQIVRLYKDHDYQDKIQTGLTLEQAQAHCSNPETSSSTCTDPEPVARTKAMGAWFDAYGED